MTWLAPWALVGIAAVAVPVLVHWLARHQAMRVRFPTIQFLVQSSPVSVRRYRVKDLPLLAVRIGIVAAAALALAQPVWVRAGAPAARPARAIVLDTSASLQRTLPDGRVGAAVAQETAAAVTGSAATDRGPGGTGSSSASGAPAVTISTERVSEGVAQAAAWLATQVAPRELVVISDFQVGALVQSDLETVPADADVRLLPVAVSGPVAAPPAPARGQLRVLASREDAGAAAAAESAARSIVPPETSEVVLGLGTQNDLRGRFGCAVFAAQRHLSAPVALAEGAPPLAPGSRVFALAGIAGPDRFTQAIAGAGYVIAGSWSPGDHYRYAAADLARLASDVKSSGADAVLTTSKDAVRLLPLRPLPVEVYEWPLHVTIEPADEFSAWLRHRRELARERHTTQVALV